MSSGYVSDALRQRVREQAGNRCGYCLSAQEYVLGILEIDHIIPTALDGSDEEINLWLACRMCNGYKDDHIDGVDPITGQRIPLFNPRNQNWSDHFMWDEDGIHIIGLTPCGRTTVGVVQLNNHIALTVRKNWVRAGWHPPQT